MRFRLEQPFTAFDQQTHFQASVAWQGIFSLLWSPIHAKLKFSETTILHGDLFVVAGAGRTADPTVQGLTWEAGAGAKIYFNRFFVVPAGRPGLRRCRRRCWGAGASPTT